MALAGFLVSCSTMPPAQDAGPAAAPPRYSLVFVVHGDGDYLYHDAAGNARRADEQVVAEAQAIAQRNPDAEVVIFHEIKRRHVLFVIPRKDGRAYYYRYGSLVAERSYWRDQGESRFAPEIRLHSEFVGMNPRPAVRLFLYFGHELPEFDRTGYDNSYSHRRVSMTDLAEGLKGFTQPADKIDLLVLGTCYGGTPHTIGALAPYARTIIASPDNLHLSYFDLEPLAQLNISPEPGAVSAFAERFARNAFDQLARDVQTTVSVVVYDADDVSAFTGSVAGAYQNTLVAAAGLPQESVTHCDCADDSTVALPAMSKGLTVLYRAPRFGRMKNEQHHSGWECWRITD